MSKFEIKYTPFTAYGELPENTDDMVGVDLTFVEEGYDDNRDKNVSFFYDKRASKDFGIAMYTVDHDAKTSLARLQSEVFTDLISTEDKEEAIKIVSAIKDWCESALLLLNER